MPLGKQADQNSLDQTVLAHDDALYLENGTLEVLHLSGRNR